VGGDPQPDPPVVIRSNILEDDSKRSFPGGTSFLTNGGSEVSPPLLRACSCTQDKVAAKTEPSHTDNIFKTNKYQRIYREEILLTVPYLSLTRQAGKP
jgi:hypothetical protein